jgi:hypothetical protein
MILLLCCTIFVLAIVPEDTGSPEPTALRTLHDSTESPVIEGDDGWLFLRSELNFLASGPFWGQAATQVSKARKPEWADPELAVLDFHRQLNTAGIELLLVPVPAKATVMAHKLPIESDSNNDEAMQEFMARLRASGVDVLDLKPVLTKVNSNGVPAYLKTDTHWSPAGLKAASKEIAQWLEDKGLASRAASPLSPTLRSVVMRGDLVDMQTGTGGGPTETVMVEDLGGTAPAMAQSSPITLLGDSHALVFSAGQDMHAKDAGLVEHLSAAIDAPIDRVAVRGSGASATRIELLRRRDQMAGKKAVIWLFAARDLTESDGWRVVPVLKPLMNSSAAP